MRVGATTSALARAVLAIACSALAWPSVAGDTRLDEGYADAFLHYRPYAIPAKPAASAPKAPPSPAAVAPASSAPGAQPVTVAWLRKNYPLLEERAIDDPSDANVSAYLYARRIILDKSQRLEQQVMKTIAQDPLLDENSRLPLSSLGSSMVRSIDVKAQERAVRELAATGGLLVFVDGACRFCEAQLPVVEMMRKDFGLEYLVISLDGAVPKSYRSRFVKDNGLFGKLGLKLTPSMVYVPNPKGYQGGADTNRYLVVAQGMYAQSDLSKQIAFAGFRTGILSDGVAKDLDIWNNGVTSVDDLRKLTLDPSQPETFKRTLEPLLLKQYR